jgi:hypothetical protein
MKFSQEQVDDTIIPKMEVGKELVKRTKNLNRNIESIMGNSAKSQTNKESLPLKRSQPTKTESFVIEDDCLVMYLYDAGDKRKKYIRLDFNDYANCDDFYMILDKPTLKGMADFIYKYLEKNSDTRR